MRYLLGSLAFVALLAAALFLTAGRVDLPYFWAYFAIVAGAGTAACFVIDRDLRKERFQPGAGGIDRRLRATALPFFVAHLAVAGLDARFHFSDTVPGWLRVVGLALFALFMAIALWAVAANRFFSPVVRIQEERGHVLVTSGPYRFVRHPGYVGAIFAYPFGALGLGSWLATAILAGPMLLILRRVIVEDRFLRENLDGYTEYARRVRWRLVPGVW